MRKVTLWLGAGLFNWSMRHQDGTRPAEAARELTGEDRRFLELAMEEYSQARCYPQQEPALVLLLCLLSCLWLLLVRC